MDGNSINSRAVRRVGLLLGMFALAPLTASQANPTADEAATPANDEAAASVEMMPEAGFEAQFEPFTNGTAPTERVSNAVDLDTFEPPLEAPAPSDRTVRNLGSGVASYYGRRFHGRRTANGERFNMNAMTAAHKTLAFGTRVRVTNQRNGRSVVVRINDRGPFVRGRTIDLSRSAAQQIGMIGSGHARVKLEVVQ